MVQTESGGLTTSDGPGPLRALVARCQIPDPGFTPIIYKVFELLQLVDRCAPGCARRERLSNDGSMAAFGRQP